MGSTFLGLTIGYSGVSTYMGAIHTTANNIANCKTEGYSRQHVVRSAAEGLRSYTSYGMVGTGVQATDVAQIRSFYYDVKYWNNNDSLGQQNMKYYYMKQIQSYYYYHEEKNGVSQMLSKISTTMEDLLRESTSLTTRDTFISTAEGMADQINEYAIALERLQSECNDQISVKAEQVNSIARQIATLNRQINTIEMSGITANELRDQRALLVDELSMIAAVEVEESPLPSNMYDQHNDPIMTGATSYRVTIGGQTLVEDYKYDELEVVARKEKLNQSDVDGLFDLVWKSGKTFNMENKGLGGELQGLIEVRDGTNAENLQGVASQVDAGADTIVLSKANITKMAQMTLPEQGKITLNYHEFTYDSFSFDSTTGEYTFHLAEDLTPAEAARIQNGPAVVGNTIDYMGIPYYMSQLNEFCRCFAKAVNVIQTGGTDFNGNVYQGGVNMYNEKAGLFFTGTHPITGEEFTFEDDDNVATGTDTYYSLTARHFRVRQALADDPMLLATASEIINGEARIDVLQQFKDMLSEPTISQFTPQEFFETFLTDVSITTKDAKDMTENYETLSNIIQSQRLSIAGVDEDEEALDMIRFREAYNLNSKVISVMNEIYNKLINETGV